MRTHRIATAGPKDGQLQDHVFLEIKPDSFIEIAEHQKCNVTHAAIHDSFDDSKHLTFALRWLRRYHRDLIIGEI